MRKTLTLGGPELLTAAGACTFIFILALSAYFEADIRWLHFFQAWMYIATIALCLRRNRWGYFIGISAAGFWNYVNLFVTTFFLNGLHWLRASLSTGQIQNVDQIIAVPAWVGNLLVVVGCIWAYGRLPDKNPRDWGGSYLHLFSRQPSSPRIFRSSSRGVYPYSENLCILTRHLHLYHFRHIDCCNIAITLIGSLIIAGRPTPGYNNYGNRSVPSMLYGPSRSSTSSKVVMSPSRSCTIVQFL